jgi:hypothetical protein
VARTPDEWTSHYFLALLYSRDDPRRALSEIRTAESLNPLEPEIDAARRRLLARKSGGAGQNGG